ncbi:MAG: YdbC family protein [Oscillospiraceae bacterium]|nr:YdbC family protein [Oscillospiraceae bacterium]
MASEINFEITEELGVLSEGAKGWQKELNLVSWNGREPKYDIREWAPNHARMGKGVTLSADEAAILMDLLGNDLNEI